MHKKLPIVLSFLALLWFVATPLVSAQSTDATFIVAAYNVENWNEIERGGKPNQPKPQADKDAVIGVLTTVRPDVLGIEEMGTTNDLAELATMLRRQGLEYPYSEWIQSSDEARQVALLSRLPIAQRYSRTDYTYLLDGKPTRVQRGFIDVLVQVNDHYSFRAIVAHLKSKRSSTIGKQEVMRLEEAQLLRAHIGKILKNARQQNLIAMGDFNDTPDSKPIRLIVGEAPFQLFDLHPLDSQGRDGTHFWRARGEFSRIDYLIASPAMSNEYVAGSARIADFSGWDKASDHRAIYARFHDHDIGSVPEAGATSRGVGPPSLVPESVVFELLLVVALGVAAFLAARRRPSTGT